MSQIRTRAQIEREEEIRDGRHLAPPPPETVTQARKPAVPVPSALERLAPGFDAEWDAVTRQADADFNGVSDE
jgi:hypothetical protein